MPIYEYQCKGCGNSFEVLQGINETPELSCDKCAGGEIVRVLSAGAFVFKGSGFYATDYKNKDKGRDKEKAKDSVKDSAKETAKETAKAKDSAPSCDSCAPSGGCRAASSDA